MMTGEGTMGGTRHSGTVLIVDDEMGPRESLRMLLKEEHRILTAPDVASAQVELAQERVDVVITDLRMPNQSGLDLLRYMSKMHPDIQVIILTGFGQLDSAMEAVELGAYAYMEKPFDSDTMLEHIQGAMVKRQRELDRRSLERLALEANRFETLGRVVSAMVHDLGTPLSVIGSNLELMMIEGVPSEKALNERAQLMLDQIAHCTEIVRSTLNFLRHQSQSRVMIDVNDMVGRCLDLAKAMLQEHRVKAVLTLAPNLPLISGDSVLLRQAILNLVNNACQAMDEQEGERLLSIKTWEEAGQVWVSIRDTGPGVCETDTQRIFDAFYSTKGDCGTGLGLAVVRSVMRAHSGDVLLGEGDRAGAEFVLRFPVPQGQ